jgi:hypothetical protein
MERYYDDKRRSMRTQKPRPERVAAAQDRLLCRSSLAYLLDTRQSSLLASENLRCRNLGHGSFLNWLLTSKPGILVNYFLD